MSYNPEYLKWLQENADSYRNDSGDVVPPWEKFPHYERYTIGWRMGLGEAYLGVWRYAIELMPNDFDLRLAYFRRHRPAPINWGDMILPALYPDQESDEEFGLSETETEKLLDLGIIEHDIAFQTWLAQNPRIVWPWELSDCPIDAARHYTRKFWFSSRQIKLARDSSVPFQVPETTPASWEVILNDLKTGRVENANPTEGLLTLGKMFCAGDVAPPWLLGLTPEDFQENFDDDMNYVDAYRLWLMFAFDDSQLLTEMLTASGIPSQWNEWIEEQSAF